MAKVISFGVSKGGAGKTTSLAVTSYLLAKEGYKVLAIDLDLQGSLTKILSQRDIFDFDEMTILEAMKDQDALRYTVPIIENLDLIPSNDCFALLPKYLYNEYPSKLVMTCLDRTLRDARKQYDFILLDCPASCLSEATLNALVASDYAIVLFETSEFCWEAIPRFIETVQSTKEKANAKLELAGILTNVIDVRSRKENQDYVDKLNKEYPGMRFENIVNRTTKTRRLQKKGFSEDNPELEQAVEPFKPFVKELLSRVQ